MYLPAAVRRFSSHTEGMSVQPSRKLPVYLGPFQVSGYACACTKLKNCPAKHTLKSRQGPECADVLSVLHVAFRSPMHKHMST